ncbi:MAG: lysophospholipid acyltransferase family protein [Planctomycetales bacterium]|nr:lysophospholipid acyltransferase family protein [Planctomycetales bacterium]
MKFQLPWLRRLAGFHVATGGRLWMGTLDYKAMFFDETVDPAHDLFRGPAIYVFWHEYILAPFFLRGHCRIAMLLSRHRDADWLAEAARFMGFESIRGSTFRGGQAALREMARRLGKSNIAITPDGPRGPRRQLAQGPIYLASTLGVPLVAMGLGYDRPWRMPTWDRFALPRLGSRARAIVGPRLHIPGSLSRAELEEQRLRVEGVLNRLTVAAEAWAAAGVSGENQQLAYRKPAPLPRRRLPWNELGGQCDKQDDVMLDDAVERAA